MDNREISDGAAFELAVEAIIAGMFFNRLGIIEKFNGDNTVDVRVAIKGKAPVVNGKVEYYDLPIISKVPLITYWSPSAGMVLTTPIRPGDPCTLYFSDRMNTLFLKTGTFAYPEAVGQNNVTSEPRQHDMTDAMCFPGILTYKPVIPNWSTENIELRDMDRQKYVSVGPNGVKATTGGATVRLRDSRMWLYADEYIAVKTPLWRVEGPDMESIVAEPSMPEDM